MFTDEEIKSITFLLEKGFLTNAISHETLKKIMGVITPQSFVSKKEIVSELHCSANYPNWLFKTGKLECIVISQKKKGTTRESLDQFLSQNREKIMKWKQ